MKRTLAMVTGWMLILATAAIAAPMRGSADVVKAAPAAATITAHAGERVKIAIDLDITKSWHIYAHGDTNFIGVDLKPAASFPLTDLQVTYPAGHEAEFFGEPVFMISGQDRIAAAALVPKDLAKGEHALEFGVTVQACNDKSCLAPVDLPVKVTLVVE